MIAAMQAQNVFIGRIWPVWPNSVRITVGSAADMARFKTAFRAVMDGKATASAAAFPLRGSTFLS